MQGGGHRDPGSRLLAGLRSPGRSLWPRRTDGTETKKNQREEMSVPLSGQVLGGGVGGLTAGQSVREHLGLGGGRGVAGGRRVHTGPAPAWDPWPVAETLHRAAGRGLPFPPKE